MDIKKARVINPGLKEDIDKRFTAYNSQVVIKNARPFRAFNCEY